MPATPQASLAPRPAHGDPWWMTARIYQVLVHAYQDSNGDGWGDIPGLISRLKYIAEAGFNAIWLPPVFDSPRRDAGYDNRNFYRVDPRFGTVEDLRRLCDEAHELGIRIIADWPGNHTSDQHQWFQASSDPGHPDHETYRDWYLWSDDPHEWDSASVIFTDHESSNAEWHPGRQQYYCHRFYRHMPCLNHDHPAVQEESRKILRFLFELGVDVVRVDAAPHFIKRKGKSCESLPETFELFRKLGQWVRDNFPGRGLLCEACQPPEKLVRYLEAGFDIGFDFVSQPPVYEAVLLQVAEPLDRLVRRLGEFQLPAGTTLVGFQGIHDEHTWECCLRIIRHVLWQVGGKGDPRRTQNWGTVGRIASLVDGDRRRWELMLAILYALPGAKLVMYGDELRTGDRMDVARLPEELRPDYRRAVRTIMPWTGAPGAGFSTADRAMFCADLVDDPALGFRAINVEAQERNPFSELAFTRGLNRLAAEYGDLLCTGRLGGVPNPNAQVATWTRHAPGRLGEDILLAVFNTSDTEQEVDLDLPQWEGRFASAIHPTILWARPSRPRRIMSGKPFHLTLPPYGFGYYLLDQE